MKNPMLSPVSSALLICATFGSLAAQARVTALTAFDQQAIQAGLCTSLSAADQAAVEDSSLETFRAIKGEWLKSFQMSDTREDGSVYRVMSRLEAFRNAADQVIEAASQSTALRPSLILVLSAATDRIDALYAAVDHMRANGSTRLSRIADIRAALDAVNTSIPDSVFGRAHALLASYSESSLTSNVPYAAQIRHALAAINGVHLGYAYEGLAHIQAIHTCRRGN